MSLTMNAAFSLGETAWTNLHSIINTEERPIVKKLFEVSQRLIREHEEDISGVSQFCWQTSPRERLSLLSDEAIRFSTAKVYVFSDSVLCLGKVHPFPQSNVELENKREWFKVLTNTENWIESMENLWKSSGTFSQDSPRCRFSPRSKE